jgi:hypothetical protein
MLRRIACGLGLAALMALASGCGTTTTTPIVGTPLPTAETFSGLLYPVNANVFSFVAQTGGAVTATLTSVGPDATQTIGFSLGTFNTATNQCSVVFDNNPRVKGLSSRPRPRWAPTACGFTTTVDRDRGRQRHHNGVYLHHHGQPPRFSIAD